MKDLYGNSFDTWTSEEKKDFAISAIYSVAFFALMAIVLMIFA